MKTKATLTTMVITIVLMFTLLAVVILAGVYER